MGDIGMVNQELWGGTQILPAVSRLPVAVGRARNLLREEAAQLNLPRLSVDHIASWDRPSLIRELVREAQDPRWVPSQDEVKALICVMARDQFHPEIVHLDASMRRRKSKEVPTTSNPTKLKGE